VRFEALASLLVCLLAFILPGNVAGQVLTTVEFSFSNPGARSMGFGGAFVALADDATAAFANPAGLVQLTRPEVSTELRSWQYSSPYTTGGRAAGTPTGFGIDTVSFPVRGESEADLTRLSFISLVYPTGDWSFAFYQHQLMNFEMSQETQGLFAGSGIAGTVRGPIERGFFDFEITTRALAVGYRVNERLSLGLGSSYFDSSSYFTGNDYLPDEDTVEGHFARASFLPERLSHDVRAEISGGDWGMATGFLWSVSRNWKLGGVYRQGPELRITGELVAGPVSPTDRRMATGPPASSGTTSSIRP
jgi:long-subunit fatty acid transport protein